MAIIASAPGNKSFVPCPIGVHAAVLVDVVDCGTESTKDGPKHRVRLCWQIGRVDDITGRRFDVIRTYNLTLGEGCSLLRDLESWRGRAFTKDEANGFDL